MAFEIGRPFGVCELCAGPRYEDREEHSALCVAFRKLRDRSNEQDRLIAYLYARFLPNPWSFNIPDHRREKLQKAIETLGQIVSGEKRVRSWAIKPDEILSPELE